METIINRRFAARRNGRALGIFAAGFVCYCQKRARKIVDIFPFEFMAHVVYFRKLRKKFRMWFRRILRLSCVMIVPVSGFRTWAGVSAERRGSAAGRKGRSQMSKRVQKVWNAVTTVLVILVVILALLLVGVRLVGLRPMCVLSGSMEPTYHTGSLIYVKPCAPEDVQVGDAITFVLNEDLDVVTHRVISIDVENEHFYTQGDANDAPDGAPVYFKNLIGRPVFTIPYLGYVSHWVSNPPGMYLAIALALVLIILTFLPDMLRKASEADARDAARRAQADPQCKEDAKKSVKHRGN